MALVAHGAAVTAKTQSESKLNVHVKFPSSDMPDEQLEDGLIFTSQLKVGGEPPFLSVQSLQRESTPTGVTFMMSASRDYVILILVNLK
ncbi:hypothetical protein LDENG_00119580 [Lucifuga dentata]|nr:hypothetical protein LDENG_00119580 [Lucifuga dentata]